MIINSIHIIYLLIIDLFSVIFNDRRSHERFDLYYFDGTNKQAPSTKMFTIGIRSAKTYHPDHPMSLKRFTYIASNAQTYATIKVNIATGIKFSGKAADKTTKITEPNTSPNHVPMNCERVSLS